MPERWKFSFRASISIVDCRRHILPSRMIPQTKTIVRLHEQYKDKFKAQIISLCNSIFAVSIENWLSDETLD